MPGGTTTIALLEPDVTGDARPTIGELFTQLVDGARGLFQAEVALYRIEAGRRSLSAGWAAGLLIGALTLAQGALIALLVGLIMILAPAVGIVWAVVIVTVGAVALAGLLGWLGVRQISRVIDPDKAS